VYSLHHHHHHQHDHHHHDFYQGGIYGVIEGWKGAANSNYKIRFNSVMNAFSKRGSALGNSLAIVGR
jgi:hypothetical protein